MGRPWAAGEFPEGGSKGLGWSEMGPRAGSMHRQRAAGLPGAGNRGPELVALLQTPAAGTPARGQQKARSPRGAVSAGTGCTGHWTGCEKSRQQVLGSERASRKGQRAVASGPVTLLHKDPGGLEAL